jgi:hypothetical protein
MAGGNKYSFIKPVHVLRLFSDFLDKVLMLSWLWMNVLSRNIYRYIAFSRNPHTIHALHPSTGFLDMVLLSSLQRLNVLLHTICNSNLP